jgi:hypothetical protein
MGAKGKYYGRDYQKNASSAKSIPGYGKMK